MSYRALRLPILFLGLACFSALAHAQSVGPSGNGKTTEKIYDAKSFDGGLQRLLDLLQQKPSASQIAQLNKSLPLAWTVATPERTYSISSQPLRGELSSQSTEEASAWVKHLREEIKSSQTTAAMGTTAARTDLDNILSRAEFGAVRPPGAFELLRERFLAWLNRMFQKFFGSMARHPIGAEILFWALLVGGIAFVALCVYRFLSGPGELRTLRVESSGVPAPTWQEWLRSARQAANRDDFRDAIHSVYWAGIARLEDLGAVPRDRAKTPREYLRLVSSESNLANAGLESSVKEPLAILTTKMEQSWYADRGANANEFRDSLSQLEALGCPLE